MGKIIGIDFAQLLRRGLLNGQGGIQAVADRQQAFGKALDAEFARLGDFVFRAAAHILGLGRTDRDPGFVWGFCPFLNCVSGARPRAGSPFMPQFHGVFPFLN